jgi:hypothetical protein
LDARQKRIGELMVQIDTLQRHLPPEVILGVKVGRREQAKRVERRERAA